LRLSVDPSLVLALTVHEPIQWKLDGLVLVRSVEEGTSKRDRNSLQTSQYLR
jgi:hypothetical protein